MYENEGICRVEPTIQDVRELCFVLHMKVHQIGLKSLGRVSEREIRLLALDLTFLSQTHHDGHIAPTHQKSKFYFLSEAGLEQISGSKMLPFESGRRLEVKEKKDTAYISFSPNGNICAKREYCQMLSSAA